MTHYHSADFGSVVKIFVGPRTPTQEVLYIHKHVLCEVSSYFKAALDTKILEGEEQHVDLSDERICVMQYFQVWIYSRTLLGLTDGVDEATAENVLRKTWWLLIDLYIFADQRGIPGLQNSAMDSLIDLYEQTRWYYSEIIKHAYEHTSAESLLRRWLVDVWSSDARMEWFEDTPKSLTRAFLLDVAKAYRRRLAEDENQVADFRRIRARYLVET